MVVVLQRDRRLAKGHDATSNNTQVVSGVSVETSKPGDPESLDAITHRDSSCQSSILRAPCQGELTEGRTGTSMEASSGQSSMEASSGQSSSSTRVLLLAAG